MGVKTLIDVFEERVSDSGDAAGLRFRTDEGWTSLSFSDWLRSSTLVAAGLVRLGVEAGGRVGLLSRTRPEWVVADQAILVAGAVCVPVYETNRPRQCRLVLEDSGCSVVFVEDPAQLEKVLSVYPELPDLRAIVYFDEIGETRQQDGSRKSLRLEALRIDERPRPKVMPLSELRELGARALGADPNIVMARRRAVLPAHTASLVYTAGTTGTPRGVMLSHRNFVAQIEANRLALPIGADDEQLIFLPLAQVYARSIYMTGIAAGCVTTFAGVRDLEGAFREVAPTLFIGVPRIFEKTFERTVAAAAGSSRARRKLALRTLRLAGRRSRVLRGSDDRLGPLERAELALGERLFLRRLGSAFGPRLRFAICGGATLSVELTEYFHAAGTLVLQGYGLTEHCAAATVNRVDDFRFDTVGRPMPGVDVRIADDGEVLLRSASVMKGYWNRPDETRETVADGWLHTGDIGEFDGTWLRITDRKKDVIVTAGGKTVAPGPIELALREIPLIDHAVVYGDGRPHLAALITLNENEVTTWAKSSGLGDLPFDQLCQHPEVYRQVDDAIEEVNRDLPRVEAVKRFAVLRADFTLESGELTATWQTRRRFVTEKYRALLDGLYDDRFV